MPSNRPEAYSHQYEPEDYDVVKYELATSPTTRSATPKSGRPLTCSTKRLC